MAIPLPIHLFIHFSLAMLTGYLAGKYFNKLGWCILAGFCAGFLVDLDHVLEYFLVYGLNFNLVYFLQGRQFIISDKIHLWFHAWEYVLIFILLAYLLKKINIAKIIFVTLALALSVHLLSDSFINRYSPLFYTLSYRVGADFSSRTLMRPDDYQKNQETKYWLGL